MLFMPPYSAVIIIMQHSSWCPWAWMYSNQAYLLKIYPLIYCPSSTAIEHTDHMHWTRAFWLQAPRTNKLDNVTVDIEQFNALYRRAVSLTECGDKCFFTNNTYEDSVCKSERRMAEPRDIKVPDHSCTSGGSSRLVNNLKLRVSSVKVNPVSTIREGKHQALWELSISGEILNGNGSSSPHYLFSSLPHLTICIHSMLLDDLDDYAEDARVGVSGVMMSDVFGNTTAINGSKFKSFHHRQYQRNFGYSESEKYQQDSWCYPVEMFNYYADLKLTMSAPVHHLHLWLQASESGGKIFESDAYLILDLDVPVYSLERDVPVVDSLAAVTSPQLQSILYQELLMKCPARLSFNPLYIDVLFDRCSCNDHDGSVSDYVDASCTDIVCNCSKVRFHLRIDEHLCRNKVQHSPYFLDNLVIEFCRSNDFQSNRQCMELYVLVYKQLLAVLRLDRIALDGYMSEVLLLPSNNFRQLVPTPAQPFTFLHIDKSAGTTLRE